MKAFPFGQKEWAPVQEAARAVADAALGASPSRRAARFAALKSLLADLRETHGDHPVLLETEADFTPDAAPAVALYRRAELVAAAHRLPALSIRLSLARLLVEELGQPDPARQTLVACRDELPDASVADCATWTALLSECDRQAPARPGKLTKPRRP
jgi:hypothetical protein